ncbi:hypothetical protein FRY74_06310 [Vicingus serpentipes]|uniref:Uncharacterized protein n=1 Tax=Vicingus serpentipes TaxID=1926625 RepID=A0A5C6RXU3_9FLAO|nr:hypothetical protein [Vicingus serpentipes]TXB66182.1 hypothetical protein FRY74_06310 [Vicingus serpentipes]
MKKLILTLSVVLISTVSFSQETFKIKEVVDSEVGSDLISSITYGSECNFDRIIVWELIKRVEIFLMKGKEVVFADIINVESENMDKGNRVIKGLGNNNEYVSMTHVRDGSLLLSYGESSYESINSFRSLYFSNVD